MEDVDFDPSSGSSSRLGSLFASSSSTKVDKNVLRYTGEREKKDVPNSAVEEPAPSRQQEKPLFLCAASAKKINNGNVTFNGKLAVALVKASQNFFDLYLYTDSKNVLWRQRLGPGTEFQILGSCDVIFEESKSPLSIWKVKFTDYRERTDFLAKVVQCRVEMSLVAPHSGPIKQKVGVGSEDGKLSGTDSLRLSLKEYGKDHTIHIEKDLNDWSLGQSLFADEGVGCSFFISCWKEECEELSVASGSLVLLTVEDAHTGLKRSNSDDQPDGQKLREVQSLEAKPPVRDRVSNIGRPTPFLSAGNVSGDASPRRSGSTLSLQDDRVSVGHTAVHRQKVAPGPDVASTSKAAMEDATGSSLEEINLKLDTILKAVTEVPLPAKGMQKIGPFEPTIILSSVLQVVEQNQVLRDELKEKSAKIESLSEKMADLAISFKTTTVSQVPTSLQSEMDELKSVNKRLNEKLEQANYDYQKVEEEIFEAGTRVKELEKEVLEKQTRINELQSQVKELQALKRSAEADSLAQIKAEAERRQAVEAELKKTQLLAETAVNSRDKLAARVVEAHKKHVAELKKATEESNEKVKKIMNVVYRKVNKNFQQGVSYSSEDIKAAVKECIREVTMSLIDSDVTSSSSSSSVSTPKKETKVISQPSERLLEKAFNPPRDERRVETPKSLPQPPKTEPSPPSQPPVKPAPQSLAPKIEPTPESSKREETKISGKIAKPADIDISTGRILEHQEESYDIPPVRREDSGSDSVILLAKQELFGDGLSHVETPPCLPTPSMVSFTDSDQPEVTSPKRILERSRCIDFDEMGEKKTDEGEVKESMPEPREKSDSNPESDKSAELREAIQSTIEHGAHSYTPEPPPPPEFTPDSDSESDWVT